MQFFLTSPMKKLMFIVTMVLSTIIARAQNPLYYEETEFAKYGAALTGGESRFATVLSTDIVTGEKAGYLKIYTSNNTGDYSNMLTRAEIDAVLAAFKYASDNLIGSKPKADVSVKYEGINGGLIGVRSYGSGISLQWQVFSQPVGDVKGSFNSFSASNLSKLIVGVQECASSIDAFLSGN